MNTNDEPNPRLGRWLAHYRDHHDLRQQELAAAAGLSIRQIQNLEAGVGKRPQRSTLEGIERACGLSPGDAERIRQGETVPIPDESPAVDGRERDIERRLSRLEDEVALLLRLLRDRPLQ